jgi:hypothetical protein
VDVCGTSHLLGALRIVVVVVVVVFVGTYGKQVQAHFDAYKAKKKKPALKT